MPCVLVCQCDQISARTALWNMDPAVGQRLLDKLSSGKIKWQQQVASFFLHPHIAAGEEDCHYVRVFLSFDVLEEPLLAGEQLAAPDSENGHAGIISVACIPDHVSIAALDLENDGRLLHLFEVMKHV